MISNMRKDKDVPPPHPRPRLIPTPSIPPIYASVPPLISYKCPTLSISHPSEVPSIPPSTKEEKELMLVDSNSSQIPS